MDEERNYSHNTAITLLSNFCNENPKLLGLFILACIQEQSIASKMDTFPLYLSNQDYLDLAQFQSKPISSNNTIQPVGSIQHDQNNEQVRKKNSIEQPTKSKSKKNRYEPYPGESTLFPKLGKPGKLAKGEVLINFNELNNPNKERSYKKKGANSVSTAPQCFFPDTIRKNQSKKRIESENVTKNRGHSKIEKKNHPTPQKN